MTPRKRNALWIFLALAALVLSRSLSSCSTPRVTVESRGDGPKTVVLLHGLRRTPRSMDKLSNALAAGGYTVLNCGYPSHRMGIGELAELVCAEISPLLTNAPCAHFVTHSMGGIVLRAMLREHPLPNMGRVVMLAPPNRGSELADRLGGFWLYRQINGPAGNELGTSADSAPNRLGPPEYPVGVVAGDRTLNPFYSWLIPGPDDGKVSVERARLEGMSGFICLPVSHTWMMRDARVVEQTLRFLRDGAFEACDL